MLYVVNYHYIRENFETKYKSIYGVTPEKFSKNLDTLQSIGKIIGPEEVSSNILNSYEKYILITFDDGLREQYKYALPILTKRNIKALFFVSTLHIQKQMVYDVHKIHLIRTSLSDKEILNYIYESNIRLDNEKIREAYNFYRFDNKIAATVKYILNIYLEKHQSKSIIDSLFSRLFNESNEHQKLYMGKEEIMQLANLKMLGSHCISHSALGTMSDDDIEKELLDSRNELIKITGSKINYVSYPYGSGLAVNNIVFEKAKMSGYSYGFTTYTGINTCNENVLALKRFDCNDIPGEINYNKEIWK